MKLQKIAQDMLKKGSEHPQMVDLQKGLRLMLIVNGNHQLSLTRDNVFPSDSEVLIVRNAFGVENCQQERLQRGKAHTIKLSWSTPEQVEKQADAYLEAERIHFEPNAGDFFFVDGQTYRDRWGGVYVAIEGRSWLLLELNKTLVETDYHWLHIQVWGYIVNGERLRFGEWRWVTTQGKKVYLKNGHCYYKNTRIDQATLSTNFAKQTMFRPYFNPILAEREVFDFTACEVEWVKFELEY